MPETCISLTAQQICVATLEGYTRLTGNFVGPLQTSSCPNSGFIIRDANGCNSIDVRNQCYIFCKNNINYLNNQDVVFGSQALCKNFVYSGVNNCHAFIGYNNSLSVGSLNYNCSYNGLQVYNINPSVLIYDTDGIPNHCLSFKTKSGSTECDYLSLTQNVEETCLKTFKNLKINTDSKDSLSISGNYVGINSILSTGYNLISSGCSLFRNGCFNVWGNSCFSGNMVIHPNLSYCTGISGCVFSTTQANNSLLILSNTTVCGKTFFCDCVYFFKAAFDCPISAPSISADSICSNFMQVNSCMNTNCLNVLNGAVFNNVNICGSGKFSLLSGNTLFGDLLTTSGLDVRNLNLISGNACLFSTSGCFCETFRTKCSLLCCDDIRAGITNYNYTGIITGVNCLFGNSLFSSSACFSNVCMCSGVGAGLIDGFSIRAKTCLCADSFLLNTGSISSVCVSQVLCQLNSNANVILNSNCFTVGTTKPVSIINGGIYNAINTSKAYGVICLSNGGVCSFINGFNLSGVSVSTFYCNNTIPHTFYSLKLSCSIKYPFHVNFRNISMPMCFSLGSACSTNSTFCCVSDSLYSRNPNYIILNCASTVPNPTSLISFSPLISGNNYFEILFAITSLQYAAYCCLSSTFSFSIIGS
jgi:hypothetical protein